MNSSQIGTQTEAIVLAALVRMGRTVLIPFGDGHRYDIAVDDDGKLIRVQCKSSRYIQGCIVFNAHSSTRNGQRVYYHGDADIFGVYNATTDRVYLVPVNDLHQEGRLRVEVPLNNQLTGIRWARDYELRPVSSTGERLAYNEEVGGSTPSLGTAA